MKLLKIQQKIQQKKQRGVAMLIALMALVLLAIIGMGFMFMADTENSVNNNYKDSQKAYFAARGGLESVRALLASPNPNTGLGAGPLWANAMALDGIMPTKGVPFGAIYVKNSNGVEAIPDPTTGAGNTITLNPTLDDELCHEWFAGLNMAPPGNTATPCGATGITGELMGNAAPLYFQASVNPAQILGSGQPTALPFKWVRITNKQNLMGLLGKQVTAGAPGLQVCWDGANEQVVPIGATCVLPPGAVGIDMRPVWLLTALAVTPGIGQNPGSRRIVQMEVALAPPINTNATVATQSPITLKGKLTVSGNDSCKCAANGTALLPGGTCDKSRFAVYTGAPFCDPSGLNCSQGINPNGIPAQNITGNTNQTGVTQYNTQTGAVTTPGATGQGSWPYNVPDLIKNYANGAMPPNFTCTPVQGSFANCGTQTGQAFGKYPTSGSPPDPNSGTPAIVYVPGSVHLSGNTTGDGVLIIDGDLDVHGGLDFYGLILVKGSITFSGGGSEPVNLYGAILAGKDVSASDSIGGSFNFQYNSCALKQSATQQPPRLLATHEIMF